MFLEVHRLIETVPRLATITGSENPYSNSYPYTSSLIDKAKVEHGVARASMDSPRP
jgi:hypothetical protein